jgi:hypothetical protein
MASKESRRIEKMCGSFIKIAKANHDHMVSVSKDKKLPWLERLGKIMMTSEKIKNSGLYDQYKNAGPMIWAGLAVTKFDTEQ